VSTTSTAPVSTTSTAPAPSGASPPLDPSLGAHVPPIAGFEVVADAPADELWPFYDLPPGVSVYPAAIIDETDLMVGRLIVARAGNPETSTIDVFVERLLAKPVSFVTDTVEVDDTNVAAVNQSWAAWTEIAGAAVVRATLPDDNAAQWTWAINDIVWTVRGTFAAEAYVEALIAAQVPELDDYDHQGLIGNLFDRTPVIDGYTYLDSRRGDTLAALPLLGNPECYSHVYLGYIRPAGVDVSPMTDSDLGLTILHINPQCVERRYADELFESLADAGLADADIGGRPVRRDDTTIYYVSGDIVIQLGSHRSDTMVEMAPFIADFLRSQPD
jgi:hypothetical protein